MLSEPPPSSSSGRASPAPESRYTGPVPTLIESPSVASRRRNRSGMISAFLGLLLFGLASFWIFTPRGGNQTPEAAASAASGSLSAGASGSPSASASASLASGAPSASGNAASASPSGVPMPKGDIPGWHQTFAEDFISDPSSRWYIYSGQPGGDPLGWWNPSHVTTSGGLLNIAGRQEATPNGTLYVTGGLSSSKSFTQSYGRFEVRFRMDKGYGLAYALLLWPQNDQWPPEIDIAEDNAKNRDMTSSTLHYGSNNSMVHREVKGGDYSLWHTAELDWTPGKLVYRMDGNVWATMTTSSVPSTPMGIVIQSQAWPCGTWEGCPNSTTPAQVNLQVDWVVAYSQQ